MKSKLLKWEKEWNKDYGKKHNVRVVAKELKEFTPERALKIGVGIVTLGVVADLAKDIGK